MKSLLFLSLALLGGCGPSVKTPDRGTSNQIGQTVTVARDELLDRASGNNAAIETATNRLPDSREKEVIKIFVDDQYGLLGQPKIKTRTDFEAAATSLLSADAAQRSKGEALRIKLSTENEQLKENLKKLEADFKAARIKEEADHKAEIQKARLEGEEKQKRLIAYIFFGGGGLLVAAGVVILMTASQVPMFGPKVGLAVIAAGGAGILTGAVVVQLMKQLDEHPWILWMGFGVILLLLTGAGAIAYANHKHHLDSPDVTK